MQLTRVPQIEIIENPLVPIAPVMQTILFTKERTFIFLIAFLIGNGIASKSRDHI